jgi:hypothetical protein
MCGTCVEWRRANAIPLGGFSEKKKR